MPELHANLVDIPNREIFTAKLRFGARITEIERLSANPDPSLPYLLPGFIDAHVHIESSMLVPAEFARLAVPHGTVATVSDPHEIANVCGMEGIRYMIRNGKQVPFKFNFGAPSCVPATVFETAGATLNSRAVKELLSDPEIRYLSEMMNFPGALQGDPEVLEKIRAALELGKPVDGHAPGLRGDNARQYIARGITTDHECFTREEAEDKLKYGMKIIIREGSAARNFEALAPLLDEYPHMMMFGSDDKHPDELALSHINALCARAVKKGSDVFNVLRAACINPALHYKLDVGLLRKDDPADFILTHDLRQFRVMATYINGQKVAGEGRSLITPSGSAETPPNVFNCAPITPDQLRLPAKGDYPFPLVGALDGQLITTRVNEQPKLEYGCHVADPSRDILKLVVFNRYESRPPAIAFIRNMGLQHGAIASSVAHDSHNIVAAGADDESIARAINLIVACKGGISIANDNLEMVIPLPVGGLMSDGDGYRIAELYSIIDGAAKEAGSTLRSPFMTLSFMALLVIPHLKLSDKGLFDGDAFRILA